MGANDEMIDNEPETLDQIANTLGAGILRDIAPRHVGMRHIWDDRYDVGNLTFSLSMEAGKLTQIAIWDRNHLPPDPWAGASKSQPPGE